MRLSGPLAVLSPDHRSRSARGQVVFVVALVLGLHAVWWIKFAPDWKGVFDQQSVSAGPRVTFLNHTGPGGPHADLQSDVRALWSPVLFSLPTPMGFSRSLIEEEIRLRPPADGSPPSAFLLQRDDVTNARTSFVNSDSYFSIPLQSALAPSLPPVAEPVFAPRISSTNFVLHVLWTDGFENRSMQTIPVEEKSPWIDEKAWEASAFVEVDGQGAVQHVFLEKASSSRERNAAIIGILKSFRIAPAPASRSGRVVIRYENDATLTALPEGAVAP